MKTTRAHTLMKFREDKTKDSWRYKIYCYILQVALAPQPVQYFIPLRVLLLIGVVILLHISSYNDAYEENCKDKR